MSDIVKTGNRVTLRRPVSDDCQDFISLMRRSQSFHEPWCFPPTTEHAFTAYLQSRERENQDGFLICCRQNSAIMGVINLNEIVRGCFQSAYLGYYIGAPYAGQGSMREALMLVIDYAFRELGLHRLEANIQPANIASIALVKGCGFHYEGFSPRYLNICGDWRDHERWTILADSSQFPSADKICLNPQNSEIKVDTRLLPAVADHT